MINKKHNTGSSKSKGFTLVELMIVVAIIAILATIAFPSYTQYVVRVHRLEAMDEMQSMLSAEEKYFVENLKYTDLVAGIGFAGRTLEKYTISMAFCSGNDDGCVKISAQPTGSQASDGLLTITTEGAKTGPWD